MNKQMKEILCITQEECAEVTQSILVEKCIITDTKLNAARMAKKEKLKIWSNIYKDA